MALARSRLNAAHLPLPDWEDYAEYIVDVLSRDPHLANSAERYAPRPDYRPLTRFENRGLKLGYKVWDIVFRRI